MIDSVAGSAVSEVAAEDVPIWAAALPAAARAAACGAAAVPGDEDAVELPAEHPAASRQAPPSNALVATARASKDDVMPLGRASPPARFRLPGHSFATCSSGSGSGSGALVHGRSDSAAAGNSSTDSSEAPIRAAA